MYLKISFVFLILFGVVHANSDSGLGLLRQHSVDAFASRHAVIIVEPPSRIARDSYLFGGHLEGRSDGCPSGYDPCGGESCCPLGCIPCNDNTKTCCDIGTFCTYNGTKPVCGCFGISCPGENKPPPTSSTHHMTTTSKSVTFSSIFDPFTSTSTSTSTSTGQTTGSVGFSSTTTSLSIPTSSVAPLPSTTTSASGSSSGNAGGKTSAAAAVDFKPPLLTVLGMSIVTLLIDPTCISFLG